MKILLVTTRSDQLAEFISGLDLNKHEPVLAESGRDALDFVHSIKPDLVIVDKNLPDYDSLDLVREIVRADAMVNTAVITEMNRKEFHEKSEGLGVLSALPGNPGNEDAGKLLLNMKNILMAGMKL
jgi:DNA-binding response OmpR family regulator